jgi:hypothetical protein
MPTPITQAKTQHEALALSGDTLHPAYSTRGRARSSTPPSDFAARSPWPNGRLESHAGARTASSVARTAMRDRIDGMTRSAYAAPTRIISTPATARNAPRSTSETHTRPAKDERSRTIATSSSSLVKAKATSEAGIPQESSQTTAAGQPTRASPRSVGSFSLSVELPSHSVNAVASPELCALLARLIRRRRAWLKGDAAA